MCKKTIRVYSCPFVVPIACASRLRGLRSILKILLILLILSKKKGGGACYWQANCEFRMMNLEWRKRSGAAFSDTNEHEYLIFFWQDKKNAQLRCVFYREGAKRQATRFVFFEPRMDTDKHGCFFETTNGHE